jgi:hypothetical protein
MFGPENASDWEEVSGIFLYYPEMKDVPAGTKSTSALVDILGKYAARKGLDGQALEAYRNTMIDRLYNWRSVFETKEMVAAEADDPYLHHSSFHLACHQSWGLPHQQLVVLIYWQLFSKAAEKPILQQNTMARQFHAHQ